ncbi:hypothetical protein B0H14DRAFT_2887456, partial [Mycena olivaceomarginata]
RTPFWLLWPPLQLWLPRASTMCPQLLRPLCLLLPQPPLCRSNATHRIAGLSAASGAAAGVCGMPTPAQWSACVIV